MVFERNCPRGRLIGSQRWYVYMQDTIGSSPSRNFPRKSPQNPQNYVFAYFTAHSKYATMCLRNMKVCNALSFSNNWSQFWVRYFPGDAFYKPLCQVQSSDISNIHRIMILLLSLNNCNFLLRRS